MERSVLLYLCLCAAASPAASLAPPPSPLSPARFGGATAPVSRRATVLAAGALPELPAALKSGPAQVLIGLKVTALALQTLDISSALVAHGSGLPLAPGALMRSVTARRLCGHPLTAAWTSASVFQFILDAACLAWLAPRVRKLAGKRGVAALIAVGAAAAEAAKPSAFLGADLRFPYGIGASAMAASFLGFLSQSRAAGSEKGASEALKPLLPALCGALLSALVSNSAAGMAARTVQVGTAATRAAFAAFLGGALVAWAGGPRYKRKSWRRNEYLTRRKARLPLLVVVALPLLAFPGMSTFWARGVRLQVEMIDGAINAALAVFNVLVQRASRLVLF